MVAPPGGGRGLPLQCSPHPNLLTGNDANRRGPRLVSVGFDAYHARADRDLRQRQRGGADDNAVEQNSRPGWLGVDDESALKCAGGLGRHGRRLRRERRPWLTLNLARSGACRLRPRRAWSALARRGRCRRGASCRRRFRGDRRRRRRRRLGDRRRRRGGSNGGHLQGERSVARTGIAEREPHQRCHRDENREQPDDPRRDANAWRVDMLRPGRRWCGNRVDARRRDHQCRLGLALGRKLQKRGGCVGAFGETPGSPPVRGARPRGRTAAGARRARRAVVERFHGPPAVLRVPDRQTEVGARAAFLNLGSAIQCNHWTFCTQVQGVSP